jgi:integrating conjugative element protein (TIGR03758 family)
MPALDSIFAASSGVTAAHLSLGIRSILGALFFLWAAWNIYGHTKLLQEQHVDIHDFPLVLLRILLLCAWVVLLIFIH